MHLLLIGLTHAELQMRGRVKVLGGWRLAAGTHGRGGSVDRYLLINEANARPSLSMLSVS